MPSLVERRPPKTSSLSRRWDKAVVVPADDGLFDIPRL